MAKHMPPIPPPCLVVFSGFCLNGEPGAGGQAAVVLLNGRRVGGINAGDIVTANDDVIIIASYDVIGLFENPPRQLWGR
jgi:hypothetical protein